MIALAITSMLLSAGALVSAAPSGLDSRASCVFTDAATAIKNKGACANIVLSGITVPAGTTLDLTNLKDGTTVTFEKTITFGYKEWIGPLITLSGKNIKVVGASGHVIDAAGQRWWDGKGSNGGKIKPKFFAAHSLFGSSITGLNVKNTPVQGFSINGVNSLNLDHITIDNSAGDNGRGHNTDGFDIGSSSEVFITNANVKNQDDCVAINSGTHIRISNSVCSGGHGVSIGSVGGRQDNTVSDIVVSDVTIINSSNGVRIKTIAGATGSVSGVTYNNIVLKNITKCGIIIQQDYRNGSPTGNPTSGVPITNVKLQGITGSLAASATKVQVLCGKGSCSNWDWSGLNISGGKKSPGCKNVPNSVSC